MGEITDRLWKKAVDNRTPMTGAFELLPACNLSCKMCYVRKSMAEVNALGGLIEAEQWIDWLRQSGDLGMLYPLFTGGEPFLRKDFFEIYAAALEMGMQPSINSNGTLITEEMAKWLGTHRPVKINITIYGAGEESYQNLCGDGDAYRRVRNAVSWLKKYDVPIKFNTSITSQNVADMEGIFTYAKSVDVPIQAATYMFPPVRRDASMVGKNDRLSPEDAALARVKADYLQADRNWFMGQAARFRRFVPLSPELLQQQTSNEPRSMACRAGICSFWIDWQGNIGNCGMYTSVRHSLKNRNFADAWKQIVDETAAVRYCSVCTNCPNFWLCHTCIAMVYNECGERNGRPDYLCRMSAASAKYYAEFSAKMETGELPELPLAATPYDPEECSI